MNAEELVAAIRQEVGDSPWSRADILATIAADRIENALSQSHNCNDSTRYLCCKVGMGYRAALDGGDHRARCAHFFVSDGRLCSPPACVDCGALDGAS